jgi:glycosyltransferase involved in cell wall biosynthesis
LVISAFLSFVKEQPSARLYMIYHTDELLAEVKELIASDSNKNAIVLIGKVPNPQLLYWYNSADFIVSGSHYEGSGTAVCEAMSCGCVPVVTDIFSFRMITGEGECGLLYEAGNDKALLAALLQTQQIDKAAKREKCLDYFNSTLSFQAIAQRIQEVAASL